MTSFWEPN